MDNYSLCFHDLSIGYTEKGSEKCLARGLNGYLMRSALTCLTGLNGSGKSTLLRTMDGFQKPLRGSVLLNGINITAYPLKEIAQHISIVLTEKIPCEALTVFDIVSMGRLPYTGHFGKLSASDKAIVTNALEKVGLTAFSRRRFYELSDGERQKVLIAKAIAQQTEIVLLDEPLSFLDYPSKIATLQLLQRMAHQDNISILLSIHDLDLTKKMADYIWELKDGDLTQAINEAQPVTELN
jgi:iron complex transport system ATP-binding protein